MNQEKSIFLFILIALLPVTSCHNPYTSNKEILQAEALLFENPDSAFSILSSMTDDALKNEADYAAWCLHVTHAQYKLHQQIESDSLITIARNYYTNSKLFEQEGIVYYLSGCMAEMNHDPESAMDLYKKADNALSKTKAHNLAGLVNYNMAYISMPDAHYEPALSHLNKAREYFNLSGSEKYQAYVYRDIAMILFLTNAPTDSALHYIDMALNLADKSGDSINYYSIMAKKGEIIYKSNPVEAKNMILKYLNYCPHKQYGYASFLAYIYTELNQIDSARYYFNLNKSNTSTTRLRYFYNLAGAYIQEHQKNYFLAYNHMETALKQQDSLYLNKLQSRIYSVEKQFDFSLKELENLELKISNRNKVISIFSLIMLILIIAIVLFSETAKHRKRILIKDFEQKQLESNLSSLKLIDEQKRKLLQIKLHSRTQNTLYLRKLEMGLKNQKKIDEFMENISQQAIISELEWEAYIAEANQLLDHKISLLAAQYPKLKQSDIKVITLICLNLDITDCCTLLNTSKNTLYHRRLLIKERLKLDKSTDLDQWLDEFIKAT